MPTGTREQVSFSRSPSFVVSEICSFTQAVFVTSGRHALSPKILAEQHRFVVEMGPYLKQAAAKSQEKEFYEAMFKLWFSLWPEIPVDNDDIGFAAHRMKVTKKVRG